MPNIFGASLLDLMSQGGQFLAGRQQQQRQNTIEDEKRQQEAALQQALLEYRASQTEHERALANRPPDVRYVTGPDNKLVAEGPGVEVRGQAPQYVTGPDNRLVEEGPGVEVRPPTQPQTNYVIGPDNRLVAEGPGVEVRPPGAGTTLGGVTQKKTQALYLAGKGGYDTLEGVLKEADRTAPGWFEQQVAKAPFGAGNVLATPFVRQMNQAALQLGDSWLRFTSGAAVPETEVQRFATGFLPAAGDEKDPVTSANKARARALIVEAMRVAAGMDIDVPTGLQQAGIDPTNVDAVMAWLEAQAGAAGTGAPQGTVAPAPTNPFEQRRQQRQGVR